MASFAEFERDMIRSRLAESRAALKKRGRRVAGNVPYGYRADPKTKQLVLQAEEAERVRQMFEMASAGRTPSEIAETANDRGWLTTRRGSWSPRQVLATLKNAVYAGRLQGGNMTKSGVHEAIIDEQLFQQVGSMIEARRTCKPGPRRRAIRWPLRGMLYCGRCGRVMTPSPRKRNNVVLRYFRCRSHSNGRPACKGVGVPAYEIEKFVLETVDNEQSWSRGGPELQAKYQAFKAGLPSLDELEREALLFQLVERVIYDADASTIQVDLDAAALDNAPLAVAGGRVRHACFAVAAGER